MGFEYVSALCRNCSRRVKTAVPNVFVTMCGMYSQWEFTCPRCGATVDGEIYDSNLARLLLASGARVDASRLVDEVEAWLSANGSAR